jgi:hypothetical protein
MNISGPHITTTQKITINKILEIRFIDVACSMGTLEINLRTNEIKNKINMGSPAKSKIYSAPI